ncbi:MAG: ferritin family protein [Deltaproteobacteria bacterium]
MNDPHVREILIFMLEEERKHLRFFDGLLDELRRDKEDIGEDDDLLTSMDFGIFKPYQGLKKSGGMIEDASKALGLGIAVEEGSIKFYQACKENVSSEDTRQELENIIAEEKKHKALFETMLKTFKK